MLIGIQGTKSFSDYGIFLRAMGTALSSMSTSDKKFYIYSTGPSSLNSMAHEFCNVSERSLKARGIRVRVIKVPPKWIKENILDIDYFVYFSKPKEPVSDLVDYAESKDVDIGIYRY